MLPFPPFDPAALMAEIDAVSRCGDFECSVPLSLLEFDDVPSHYNTWSQESVDVTDTVYAVDSCCANVEYVKRELVHPRPRPDGLCFMRAVFPITRVPLRFFQANALRLSLSSRCLPRFLPWFFRPICAALPPCLDFSIVDTFAFLRVNSEHFYSPRFGSHVFCGSGAVAAANGFALFGCITTCRCCWQACTVSIDEFSHQSSRGTAVVAYPVGGVLYPVAAICCVLFVFPFLIQDVNQQPSPTT